MPDIKAQTADGNVHVFPDGTAPEVIDRVIKQYVASKATIPTEKQAAATPPIAPINQGVVKPMDPSPYHEAWAGQKSTLGPTVDKALAPVGKFLTDPRAQMVMGMSGGAASEDVATTVMNEITKLGADVKASLPAAKAAQGFQDVHLVAKDLPVDATQARKLAQIAAKEAEFGGTPPKVITEFLKRTEDPTNPITYAEARKFYSNASRLSDAEAGATNPTMRRHMARFTRALGPAIENTTEQVGKLDTYKDAMKNYKTAMRLKAGAEFIKKHAVKGAVIGAVGAAGAGLYEATKK